jgi:hypothetical protein
MLDTSIYKTPEHREKMRLSALNREEQKRAGTQRVISERARTGKRRRNERYRLKPKEEQPQ